MTYQSFRDPWECPNVIKAKKQRVDPFLPLQRALKGSVEALCRPLWTPQRIPTGYENVSKSIISVVLTQLKCFMLFCDISGVPWGIPETFPPKQGYSELKQALLGPRQPPKRAPGWFNMTYNHLLYPCEVFQGHLKPLGASPGPQIIFSHFPKIGLF